MREACFELDKIGDESGCFHVPREMLQQSLREMVEDRNQPFFIIAKLVMKFKNVTERLSECLIVQQQRR
jgi:hypothetical protein